MALHSHGGCYATTGRLQQYGGPHMHSSVYASTPVSLCCLTWSIYVVTQGQSMLLLTGSIYVVSHSQYNYVVSHRVHLCCFSHSHPWSIVYHRSVYAVNKARPIQTLTRANQYLIPSVIAGALTLLYYNTFPAGRSVMRRVGRRHDIEMCQCLMKAG